MQGIIIHFTDFANAEKLANQYDAVLSLGHKLNSVCLSRNVKYKLVDFEDITTIDITNNPVGTHIGGPELSHIHEIINFVKGINRGERLLIHCFAGYSRSPAAAIIAMCELNGESIWSATKKVSTLRVPDTMSVVPNDLMISMYERIKSR